MNGSNPSAEFDCPQDGTIERFRASGFDVPDLGAHGIEDHEGRPGRLYPIYDDVPAFVYLEGSAAAGYSLTIANLTWAEPLPELEARLLAWAQDEEIIERPAA